MHSPLSGVALGAWSGLSELHSVSLPVTCGGNQDSLQGCPGMAEIQPVYGAGLNLRVRVLGGVEEDSFIVCQAKGAAVG